MFAFGYEIRVELSSDAYRHQTSHATGAPAKSIPVAFSSRVFNLVAACRLDDVRQSRTKIPLHRIPNIATSLDAICRHDPRRNRVVRFVQGIRVIFILFHGRITVNSLQL